MNQTLISRPAVHVVPELLERCDSCGAAAKLHVSFAGAGDLAFCGHHGNRFADRIAHGRPRGRRVGFPVARRLGLNAA